MKLSLLKNYLIVIKSLPKKKEGGNEEIFTEVLINSAGIFADKIAAMPGIDIESNHYKIHRVKGEYFNISRRHTGKITHLVYPTPTPVSLGIHVRLHLDGSIALGPNALYVDEINYDVDPAHLDQFYDKGREYLPFLEYADLAPDISGIRAKLQAPGEPVQDFIIRDEADKGFPGFIDLVGIDSPALTAAPAIAEMVAEIYRNL
jgi:L-2-hydroxyglutarate oxidase LhgO